jgi:hypothetical protein
MGELDLKKGNMNKKKEMDLDRNIQEYLIKHFERSYDRNKKEEWTIKR